MKKNLYEVRVLCVSAMPVTIEAFTEDDAKYRALNLIREESRQETLARFDAVISAYPEFKACSSVELLDTEYSDDDYVNCSDCKRVASCKENGAYHLVCGMCTHESDIVKDKVKDAADKGTTLESFIEDVQSDVIGYFDTDNSFVNFVCSLSDGTEIPVEYDGVYCDDDDNVFVDFKVKEDV